MLTTSERAVLSNLHFQLKSHEIHITALKQIVIMLMQDHEHYKNLSVNSSQAFNSICDSIKRQNQSAAKVFSIPENPFDEQSK